jgi:DNA primase/archaellum biogenesis ATPase FlaH
VKKGGKMKDSSILPQNLIENLTALTQEKIKRDGKGRINSSGKGAILCLYHDENNPSLHFNLYKGLIKCFGCGKKVSISEFLRNLKEHLGYDWSSTDADYKKIKETEGSLPKVTNESVYVYTDEMGKPLCYRWRRDYEDGDKDFNLFNPDGEEIFYFFGLYALPLVAKSNEIFFVEGEKVANALIQLGLVATTLCRGASGKLNKLEKQALLKLKGKMVYLCPDADKSGLQYMTMIERFLNKKGIETQFINPPENLADGEDLFDYINQLKEQGLNDKEIKEDILSLTKEDTGISFDKVIPKPTEWAIPDWVPSGKLTILAGRQGVGKTRLALILASAKANGTSIFTANGFKSVEQGVVFYFSFEDSPENLADWADTIGIKRSGNLRFFEPQNQSLHDIIKPIKKYRPELVILDPLNYFIKDENSLKEVKPVLEPLAHLAKNLDISIIAVWHRNKRETDDIGLAISGHSRISAIAKRLIMLEKQDNKIVVHFEKTKNTEPVAFIANEIKFEWIKGSVVGFGSHISKGEELAKVIKEELQKSPDKALSFNDIIKLASPFGISKDYLRTIKDRYLKDVISKPVRKDGKFIDWYWLLPEHHKKSDALDKSIDNLTSLPEHQLANDIPQQELTVKNPLKINELETQEKNNCKKIKNDALDKTIDNSNFEPEHHKKSDALVRMAKKNQNSLNNKDFFKLKIPVIPRELQGKYQIENPELYEDPDFRMFAIDHVISYSKRNQNNPDELPIVVIDGVEYIDADGIFRMEGVVC